MDNSYPLKSVHSSGQKHPMHRETSENNEMQPEAKRPKYTSTPHTEAHPGKKAITERTTRPATPAIGHRHTRHYIMNFNTVKKNLLRRPLHTEKDESVNIQSTANQQKHTLIPHTESPSEQKAAIDRKADYARSANSLVLEERLRAIPSGAAGNQEQAEMELKETIYIIRLKDEEKICCHAFYPTKTIGHHLSEVIIVFTKDTWHVRVIKMDENQNFYMNDLIRQLYIKALEEKFFDISNPARIIVGPIHNRSTLEQLAINSKTNGNDFQKIETLYSSPQGKLLKRVLSDFNFHADYYCETDGSDECYLENRRKFPDTFDICAENYLNGHGVHPHICIKISPRLLN